MRARTGWRLDRYTVQARLAPALVVALPVALATMAVVGTIPSAALWALVSWAGGTILFAQVARDGGKNKEPFLFARWSGKPTVARLRHHGPTNPITLSRWHAALTRAMGNVKLPTADQEAADPAAADLVYEACGAFLRDRTRNAKRFPLVFAENCNYGFRRNLWGMRPVGIAFALCSLGVLFALLVLNPGARYGGRLSLVLFSAGIDLVMLLGWFVLFTPDWVRVPADVYAERLLEASERV